MWRCLNDMFGYCSGEPEAIEGKEVKSGDLNIVANTCKLDPTTCGKHQLFSEQVKVEQIESHYTHQVVPKKAGEKQTKTKEPVQRTLGG